MTIQQRSFMYRHLKLMMALFFFFSSAYAITYTGRVSYNDELQMFDMTGSLIEYGDTRYDIVMDFALRNYPLPQWDHPPVYALTDSTIEQGYSVLGMPLYFLARIFPEIGLLHTTWFLNIFMSAALCTLLFFHIRLIGYDDRVAFWSSVCFGFCTILWPYSRTYLREPFLMFLVLLITHLLERSRLAMPHRRALLYPVAAIACFAVMILTKKESIVLLVAYLPLFIMPKKRPAILGIALSILLAFVLAYTDVVSSVLSSNTVIFGYRLITADFRVAFHSYLFSIGGSIWGTSPILLLVVPGAWILLRQGQSRYVGMMVLAVLSFAIGHALVAGHWFGGATLPPRFMMPVMPLVFICVLPVMDRFIKGQLPRWGRWLIGGLIIYSIWWQLSGILLPWASYTDALPPESGNITTWLPAINDIKYLRPIVLTPLWFDETLDFIWLRTGVYVWPLLFFIIMMVSGFLIKQTQRLTALAYVVLPILFIGSMMFMLVSAYNKDDTYLVNKTALNTVSHILDDEEVVGDILLLNDPTYFYYFLNTRLFDYVRVVTLPQHPGERGSFDQDLQVESEEPLELIAAKVDLVIESLITQRERLWLLMETGPYVPWSVRPMERYMAQYYYPIREISYEPIDPSVRLLEYATTAAPHVSDAPEVVMDFIFGEQIVLSGITMPEGLVYQHGDVLPISFYWRAIDRIEDSYTLAMFLVDEQGRVIQQGQDSAPYAGFSPTNTWQKDDIILDNRAIRLSEDLPDGNYYLWIRFYKQDIDGNFVYLPVDGNEIAILPVIINVN